MKTKLLFTVGLFILSFSLLSAETAPQKGKKAAELQAPTGVFDIQQSTMSSISFWNTNFGVFPSAEAQGKGMYWPANSGNEYIFGGGIWFGAKKQAPDGSGLTRLVAVGYNPISGKGCLVPGSIDDGDSILTDDIYKYRVYRSTDFNQATGETKNGQQPYQNWPLWKNSDTNKYQFGTYTCDYVSEPNQRNLNTYPNGPLFISHEDMVTIMKDTDLNRYDIGPTAATAAGYPLGLEIKQTIYSWGYGELENALIISYLIQNKSNDTLYDCYLGRLDDLDILNIATGTIENASNDRSRYYDADPTLNLGYGWSEATKGDVGRGLGYVGVALLETPAIDAQNFIRNDKLIFDPTEQLGLSSYANWNIALDAFEDSVRYNLLASPEFIQSEEPGDVRMMLSTGGFNIRPGEFCHLAVAITFANPAKGGEADGTPEDITGLTNNGKVGTLLAEENTLIGLNEKVREEYYKALGSSRVNEYLFNAEELNVYPNPASEIISLPTNLSATKNYAIYNLTGTLTAEGMTNKDINIADLQTGAYVLLIDGKVYKFIKN